MPGVFVPGMTAPGALLGTAEVGAAVGVLVGEDVVGNVAAGGLFIIM